MKLDPFSRQVQVFLQDLKSPQARSARLAKVAEQGIAEIRTANAAATGGKDIEPEITVDGTPGAPLASVRPDGVIVAQFDPLKSVLDWIGEQLVLESPRLHGRYERSHVLLIDGVEFDPDGVLPSGELYRFVNKQPYAAKIEPFGRRAAQSDQAPEGVYMVVAAVAARRFGNIAKVSYSRTFFDEQTGYMHPSIMVRPF